MSVPVFNHDSAILLSKARLEGLEGVAMVVLLTRFVLDFEFLHRQAILTALIYLAVVILPSFFFQRVSSVSTWVFLCRWAFPILFLPVLFAAFARNGQ